MSSAAVQQLLESLDARVQRAESLEGAAWLTRAPALSLAWPTLTRLLPDGGLPRGVTELTAPHALGGATRLAVEAMRAVHTRERDAWCAWIDPDRSLYAPALAQRGVDLARLLVVQPERERLARIALKVVRSGAFDVVAVDMDSVGGSPSRATAPKRPDRPPELLVRQLALAAEESGACVLVLSDSSAPRAAPWPVALRLELSRRTPDLLDVRVAKERRGRVGITSAIPFPSVLSEVAAP